MAHSAANPESVLPAQPPARWRRWLANLLIVGWLLMAVHQAAPFVPQRIHESNSINWLARALGIWQDRWPMFSPEPDSQNQRITAVVTFADGTTAEWSEPNWRSISPFARFITPRESKFLESVQLTTYAPVWPAFARRIAGDISNANPARPAPAKIELFLEISRIPAPEEGWQPWDAPLAVTERHLFHVEELP